MAASQAPLRTWPQSSKAQGLLPFGSWLRAQSLPFSMAQYPLAQEVSSALTLPLSRGHWVISGDSFRCRDWGGGGWRPETQLSTLQCPGRTRPRDRSCSIVSPHRGAKILAWGSLQSCSLWKMPAYFSRSVLCREEKPLASDLWARRDFSHPPPSTTTPGVKPLQAPPCPKQTVPTLA